MTYRLAILTAAILAAVAGQSRSLSSHPPRAPSSQPGDWPFYGHDAGGMRYSPLAQITRQNVSRLAVAWTFHTGDVANGQDGSQRSGFETTPLVVDGTLPTVRCHRGGRSREDR